MKQIIKLKEQFGLAIRTRQALEKLSESLSPEVDYLFDLEGIDQISRSAADELYNITHKFNVDIVHVSTFVQKMLDAVIICRYQPRERDASSKVIYCSTLSGVSDYLMSVR